MKILSGIINVPTSNQLAEVYFADLPATLYETLVRKILVRG
jgi:hypothetical protein